MIPGWALGMEEPLRQALLEGYVSGDGCEVITTGNDQVQTTTVSKALAFGVKGLACSLGHTVTVSYNPNPNTVIDGRTVNALPTWHVRWRSTVAATHTQTETEDGLMWTAVKKQDAAEKGCKVFNIGVADDESYVVEGIVVHNCKHFSKAKGGKPVDKRIRGLVLIMLPWAEAGMRVMIMENVEEIQTWGPLKRMKKNGKWDWYPDPKHVGRTWKAFLQCLSTGIDPNHPDLSDILEVLDGAVTKEQLVAGFGYTYECREIRAYVYGAPTIRKRLYMVARCDGRPICWPESSHKKPDEMQPGDKAWIQVSECLDWDRPCPSIFLTTKQSKAWRCKRPLAAATLSRIAKGIERYVLNTDRPFLVSLTHQGGERTESVDEPMKTITGAHRGEKAVVVPSVINTTNGKYDNAPSRVRSVQEPLSPVTGTQKFAVAEAHLTPMPDEAPPLSEEERAENAAIAQEYHDRFVAPFLTEHANATHQRNFPVDEPLRTACAQVKGGSFAAVAATMVHTAHGEQDKTGKKRGRGDVCVQSPLPTVTSSPDCAVVAASLVVNTTAHAGGSVENPAPTVCTGGHQMLVESELAPFMLQGGHSSSNSDMVKPVTEPMRTQATAPSHSLVAASMVQTGYGEREGQAPRALDLEKPMGTAVAGGCKVGVVASTLVGAGGPVYSGKPKPVDEPMNTQTTESHTCLATANMVKMRGDNVGAGVDEPMHTASAGGSHHGVVACHVTKFNTGSIGQPCDQPLSTITAGSHSPDTRGGAAPTQGVVAAHVIRHFGASVGQTMEEPAPTVVAGGQGKTGVIAAVMAQHNGGHNTVPARPIDEPISAVTASGSQQQLVAASVAAYYGSEADGQEVIEPLRTVTTKGRLSVVHSDINPIPLTPEQDKAARRVVKFLRRYGVKIEGPYAIVKGYVIVDIGMRMLTPRELFRAQGFPDWEICANMEAWQDPSIQKADVLGLIQGKNVVVPSAMLNLSRGSERVCDRPVVHVRAQIDLGRRTLQLHSVERLFKSARDAARNVSFPLPIELADFVRESAPSPRCAVKTRRVGRAESPKTNKFFILQKSGESSIVEFGKEILVNVEDVEKCTLINVKSSKCTTSPGLPNSQICEQILQTVSCYVSHVMASCIHSTTLEESLFSVDLSIQHRYEIETAWMVDEQGEIQEKALTKEQQIRMCGNSVCPPVAAALVRANVPEMIAYGRNINDNTVFI